MQASRLLAFGPYRLDVERRILLRNQDTIQLHQKALEILIVLAQRPGEVVSKDELMKEVWPDAFVEEANLTQNVFVLRKALGEGSRENRYIATVPGRGYRFVAAIECVQSQEASIDDISSRNAPNEHSSNTPSRGGAKTSNWLARKKLVALLTVLALLLIFSLATLRPRMARYYNNKGVLILQARQIQTAIGDFKWALRLSPGYAEAHYNLANAFEDIPDYDRALYQYQQAINTDPTFYPAYNNLARLYIMRRRDCEAALRLLDRAMSLNPQETSVKYTLYKNYGWASLCLGHVGQADRYLILAEHMDPGRGSASCLRAKLFEIQDRKVEAHPEWEACLAYANQDEVEPEWRIEAKEHLDNAQ